MIGHRHDDSRDTDIESTPRPARGVPRLRASVGEEYEERRADMREAALQGASGAHAGVGTGAPAVRVVRAVGVPRVHCAGVAHWGGLLYRVLPRCRGGTVSRPGKPVDTGDEWDCPPGWREVARGLFAHESGAACGFVGDGRALPFAWAASAADGAHRGVYTRADGWLDAAMREATR